MTGQICYLKLNRDVKVQDTKVTVAGVAEVFCGDKGMGERIKELQVVGFDGREKKRCIISVMRIMEIITKACPNIVIESIGEADVLIEYAPEKQAGIVRKCSIFLKIAFVCLISFFGTAFTIMAYHNDIGISQVFAGIHEIIMEEEVQGVSVLEISYSIGLALGIILFFNHFGKKKITSDPTPIEVEMYKYETDVNAAIVETAEREGNHTND